MKSSRPMLRPPVLCLQQDRDSGRTMRGFAGAESGVGGGGRTLPHLRGPENGRGNPAVLTSTVLSPHPASAVEYWFFKVNAGPVALLVDWIARRRVNENWLRVSIHSPLKRAVLFEKQASLLPNALPPQFDCGGNSGAMAGTVAFQRSCLNARRTVGQIEDVAWELEIDAGAEWIAPDIFPAKLLRIPDLVLVSAPLAAFTGWVQISEQRTQLDRAPGMMSHYWGRQLASEWWWVSANQLDREGVAVECAVLRSGIWGIPVGLPLAYLYLRDGATREFVIAPPARARVIGLPEKFEIQFGRLGAETVTLNAQGRDYGNLGDGIVNTLVGDLEIRKGGRLIARAQGTAGLERRTPRSRSE